jgi:hypothetical protein
LVIANPDDTQAQLADRMGCAVSTLQTHALKVRGKVGAMTMLGAAVKYLRTNNDPAAVRARLKEQMVEHMKQFSEL